MIYAEKGKEQECFIDFVEKAIGILAKEKYRDFLAKTNQKAESGFVRDYLWKRTE